MVWYSNKAVGAVETAPESGKKNHLTAATRCGNLNRLPQITGKRKFRTSRKKFLTKLSECGRLKKLLLIQNGSGVKNF